MARSGTGKKAPSSDDVRWTRRCIELARKGAGRVSPNPMVGCVIVNKRGQLVAEGYHRRLGGAHAEADALARAGRKARGCTMYVNLEPCRHVSKRRTEPCAPKVLEAGIARLVVGMRDPIRGHGGGARWLAKQGIEVTTGVLKKECAELNRAFLTWAREQRPHVVLKAGSSLDGRVATHRGDSQWITGPQARRDGHRLRGELDAILVGIGTVLADDPQLTARGVRGPDPVRIVIDSRLRTPTSARLLPANTDSKARVIIATTAAAPRTRQARLERAGAEIWRVGPRRRKARQVDLPALMIQLAAREIASVLVEGGGEVHRSFIDAGLVDEIRLYLAPVVFGGRGRDVGPGWLRGAGAASIAAAHRFRYLGDPVRLGDDLLIRLAPAKRS